jgi:hypothetical protein
MSKFKKENALAVKEITSFSGIERRFPENGEGNTKENREHPMLPVVLGLFTAVPAPAGRRPWK